MVFWDSRTIHSGQEAMKSREKPNMRCVVYVCMIPRGINNMAKRLKLMKNAEQLITILVKLRCSLRIPGHMGVIWELLAR